MWGWGLLVLLLLVFVGVDAAAPYIGFTIPEEVRAWAKWLYYFFWAMVLLSEYLDLTSRVRELESKADDAEKLAARVKELEERIDGMDDEDARWERRLRSPEADE